MAKIKNTSKAKTDIKSKAINSIRTNCKNLISDYFSNLITTQVDSEGKPFPKKKDSTKEIYKKKGWNENEWLVRTGASTKLKFSNISNGLSVRPKDQDKVLQYVTQSNTWFKLNSTISNDIVTQIKKDIK